MTRNFYVILFFIAIVMMTGSAAAEPTTITAPFADIYNITTLPFNVSGLSGSPGLEFELRYNSSVLAITSVVTAPAYRSSNVIPNVYNDAGIAKILIISTNGINAASSTPVILVTFTVKGTGYTPLQLQNAKWVSADFNSVAFDTTTSGLVTTNGATVPPASVITTLPPAVVTAPLVPGTPATLPTLDLPTPAETTIPAEQETSGVPVPTTVPVPERTMVLFSPGPTETGAGVPAPAETTPLLPALTAQPTTTQATPGFSSVIAFTASGLAALAYLGIRRV
jgi:hypothetical protein